MRQTSLRDMFPSSSSTNENNNNSQNSKKRTRSSSTTTNSLEDNDHTSNTDNQQQKKQKIDSNNNDPSITYNDILDNEDDDNNDNNNDNKKNQNKKSRQTNNKIKKESHNNENDQDENDKEAEDEDDDDEDDNEEEEEDDNNKKKKGKNQSSSSSGATEDLEELAFQVLTNDGKMQTLEYLLQLKNIFSGELPRMPKNYIARLVFDRQHQAVVMFKQPRSDLPPDKRPNTRKRVIGGITFRPVMAERFIEIAFCAVTSLEQRRGYGRVLMNNLKAFCQSCRWMRFLTYADNFAVTYFQKLGFTDKISMDDFRYLGYIKDYTEATVMECMLHPHIDYLHVPQMVEKQREAVFDRMREVDSLHSVFETADAKRRLLSKILNQMKAYEHSWPFLQPVTLEEAPDYYEVIKNPIDLSTMEKKLNQNKYQTIESFIADIKLMCDNCRMFNSKKSSYYKCADACEERLKLLMSRIR